MPVSGQDAEAAAVRRILAGTQAMTVFKYPRQQAAAAFGAATVPVNGYVHGDIFYLYRRM